MVSGVFPDEHAALAWLDDDTYDAPQRVARRTIETALFEGGADSGLQAYDEMRMLATLGRARLEAGDGAGALAAYQQALERVPNHPIIGKEFAWLEETVDGQAAAPALTVAELER